MLLTIHYYDFQKSPIAIEDAASALDLALISAEALHGEARVQIETRWTFSGRDRSATIEIDTLVGRHVSRLFAGYLRRIYDADAFEVDRLVIDTDEEDEGDGDVLHADSPPPRGPCARCGKRHAGAFEPPAPHAATNGRATAHDASPMNGRSVR